jgi:hypothetical protein
MKGKTLTQSIKTHGFTRADLHSENALAKGFKQVRSKYIFLPSSAYPSQC